MTQPRVAPYGSWASPITTDLIVSETIGLEQILLDGDDIYWVEVRPAEGGRSVIVRRTPDGRTTDVTPPDMNARTRVHEYGGGAFAVADGAIVFSNFSDQRLYRQNDDARPRPLSSELGMRYADGVIDRRRNRMICVREDHTAGDREPVNALVSIDLDGDGEERMLASGHDFYSSPRLSPDGRRLAWLAWNHPNMPWDGTELWVGEVREDGMLGIRQCIAGGVNESIVQPEWSPDGTLYFVSDRTGWWNLYRWRDGRVEPMCEMEAEFGRPQWVFGMSTYGFVSDRQILCAYNERGLWRVAMLDTVTRELEPIQTPYTDIWSLRARPGWAVFAASSPSRPAAIVRLDVKAGQLEILRRASRIDIDPGYISIPQPIAFPTERGLTAYGFFYPPRNRDYVGPPEERPPLLVKTHGGPTSAASTAFNLEIQYWTSRGLAVLDVNYGGSTGYGRAYRERLHGRWGLVDVDDCLNGARYLVERGWVDAERLGIRGGSAGGYTTLCALTFHDLFRVGASYYGVSDLEALAKETHKFESHYLDRLVGPYPERRDVYRARSPIHFTERLSCPVILFQGLDDRIVPPNQAERMVEALRKKGVPVAYVPFEGEQHGFRRAENIKRSLEAELYFYSRIFDFPLAD
ncbi:MAG: S9 family peptidase, partial [Acidobacteria bacterium]